MIPKKIIVHHSLTKDDETVSWGAIRRYHINALGWVDIGYHAGVELIKSGGQSRHEALLGRSWNIQGAHTFGQNDDSLGICFVGNYDLEEPFGEMLEMGAKVIRMWLWLFAISPYEVYGHNQFSDKSCPGEKFNMGRLRSLL